MEDLFINLAHSCNITSPPIDITEHCKGADKVMLYRDGEQIKVQKVIFDKNPSNNDVKAIAYPFVYIRIKHKAKLVPKGWFGFFGYDIIEGREEDIPDYEATGRNIKAALDKLELEIVT